MPKEKTDIKGLLKIIIDSAKSLQEKSEGSANNFTQLPNGSYIHLTPDSFHASYIEERTGNKYDIHISLR